MDRPDWGANCDAAAGRSQPAVRMDQPLATDDLDGPGRLVGGGIWRRGPAAAGRRARVAGDDTDFGESVFDVAGHCDQQQGKFGGCVVQGGAATCAYSPELIDAAIG